jgi:cbb3-type cytochrome oxidase subunit 3
MTVLKEGATMAQMGDLMGVMTVVFTVVMSAWIIWAWLPSRREAMEAAARLPMED